MIWPWVIILGLLLVMVIYPAIRMYKILHLSVEDKDKLIEEFIKLTPLRRTFWIGRISLCGPLTAWCVSTFKRIHPNFYGSKLRAVSIGVLLIILVGGLYLVALLEGTLSELNKHIWHPTFYGVKGAIIIFTIYTTTGLLLGVLGYFKNSVMFQQFTKSKWTFISTSWSLFTLLINLVPDAYFPPWLVWVTQMANLFMFQDFLLDLTCTFFTERVRSANFTLEKDHYYLFRTMGGEPIYHKMKEDERILVCPRYTFQNEDIEFFYGYKKLDLNVFFVESIEKLENAPDVQVDEEADDTDFKRFSGIFLWTFIGAVAIITTLSFLGVFFTPDSNDNENKDCCPCNSTKTYTPTPSSSPATPPTPSSSPNAKKQAWSIYQWFSIFSKARKKPEGMSQPETRVPTPTQCKSTPTPKSPVSDRDKPSPRVQSPVRFTLRVPSSTPATPPTPARGKHVPTPATPPTPARVRNWFF